MPNVVGPPIDPPPVPQVAWDASQDIPFPDDPTENLVAPDAQEFPYDEWVCWATTKYVSGERAMPQAGDDSAGPLPCRVVKLSAAWSKVIVRYHAVRKRKPPVLPDPRPLDTNLLLIGCLDRTAVVFSEDAATWIWTTRGKRVYACIEPVFGPLDGLMVCAPPYSTATPRSLDVPTSAFSPFVL